MAHSIARSYLAEITTSLAAESLKVAFFNSTMVYDELAVSNTYTAIAAAGGEVSPVAGGYALAGLTSSVVNGVNATKLTASPTTLPAVTFTARYALIYENTGKKVRFLIDFKGDRVVAGGSFGVTWSANGIVKFSYTAS